MTPLTCSLMSQQAGAQEIRRLTGSYLSRSNLSPSPRIYQLQSLFPFRTGTLMGPILYRSPVAHISREFQSSVAAHTQRGVHKPLPTSQGSSLESSIKNLSSNSHTHQEPILRYTDLGYGFARISNRRGQKFRPSQLPRKS